MPNATQDIAEVRSGGGSPPSPPTKHFGGGGDGGSGAPDYRDRLQRARLGMALAVGSIVMLFTALCSAYLVRQSVGAFNDETGAYVQTWRPLHLPHALLLMNTLLLLLSSFTLEMCRRKAASAARSPRGFQTPPAVPWLAITVVLGFSFLMGQWMSWNVLQQGGVFLNGNTSGSFFYLLTGVHALHLLGGLIVLACAGLWSLLPRTPEKRHIMIEATSIYWHSLALVWIGLYALLGLAP